MIKPILVEFTGTPEAGKTSTIAILKKKLEDKGYSIGIVTEAAERVYDNLSKETNDYGIWVIATTIKEIVETMNRPYDIVIVDRGILDRIFWNTFTFNKGNITKEVMQIRDEFMLSSYIPYKSDFLIVFKVSVEECIRRKGKEGKFVTSDNIKLYNDSLDEFLERVSMLAEKAEVHVINTDNTPKEEVSENVYKVITNFVNTKSQSNSCNKKELDK
ncbi:MAG: AAA family ATPase [Clostridia bacterium]|nr:AAA family ATPase [Clostridia bacterium]MDD4387311.1 AAA family ATPase [Clostridia bacterium]